MKTVTILDIANVASVSKSTVSRVLNGTAGVHPDKRQAVLEATHRLGFKPNVVARSLANGRSMTIGVLTQNIGSPFYDAISQGVIVGLQHSSYLPIFMDGQWERTAEIDAISALIGRRVDGLLLIGGVLSPKDISGICKELPTIVIARQLPGKKTPCIYVDNIHGGYIATKYLIDNGHENIAFVQGLERHPDAKDRFIGFCKALKEAGIPLDPKLVLTGDFTATQAELSVDQLCRSKIKFTAIFAANDASAYGARLALYRRNISVPEQVSIIGFDDQMESAYSTPPLTSVRQPAQEMGTLASLALLDLFNDKTFKSKVFKGTLQVRESVKQTATARQFRKSFTGKI
jgi:LacI family transcriptional regulator